MADEMKLQAEFQYEWNGSNITVKDLPVLVAQQVAEDAYMAIARPLRIDLGILGDFAYILSMWPARSRDEDDDEDPKPTWTLSFGAADDNTLFNPPGERPWALGSYHFEQGDFPLLQTLKIRGSDLVVRCKITRE